MKKQDTNYELTIAQETSREEKKKKKAKGRQAALNVGTMLPRCRWSDVQGRCRGRSRKPEAHSTPTRHHGYPSSV
ncbi:hypothetical protein BN1723_006504 [Verticillium longisporum]|uniref:Uncharacterized protein n=1 Tax=Verticillium longisporum TaxID=100787 RepID=A0A0G4NFI9_VERLO|nr:hypothetical protein BN1723_006504 [Verticillium longisporum]